MLGLHSNYCQLEFTIVHGQLLVQLLLKHIGNTMITCRCIIHCALLLGFVIILRFIHKNSLCSITLKILTLIHASMLMAKIIALADAGYLCHKYTHIGRFNRWSITLIVPQIFHCNFANKLHAKWLVRRQTNWPMIN